MNQRVAHSLDGKVTATQETSSITKLSEPPKVAESSQALSAANPMPIDQAQNSILEVMPLEQIEKILNAKVQILKDNQASLILLVFFSSLFH